jgi:hypothetical protein
MSAQNETPHALHWGYIIHTDVVEVFGVCSVRAKVVIRPTTRLRDAISDGAISVRSQIAKELNCSPDRINFISKDGFASSEPEFTI